MYIAVIIEIGQILSMAQLTLQSIHQFILVMIPIWNSWMLLDRVTNMFGAQNVTYKAFSGLYHILVATMGVNAGNAFDLNPQENTAPIFLSAYFFTQILCLLMCFTVR